MKSIRKKENAETNPCLWMQAGVVKKKDCRLQYNCSECRFDSALRRRARQNMRLRLMGRVPSYRKGRIVFWKDRLKELPSWQRPCLHHMKGSIGFRACTNDYNCSNCEFNQYFQDQFTVHTVVKPVDVLHIAGLKFPQGYYLHKGHAWVKLEEGMTVRIGLDDFALGLLGPPDSIEAPLVGREVVRGRGDITIGRGEHRAKILSPVSGVVTDVNPKLRDEGNIAHADPYTEGWIMRVHSKDLRRDLKTLGMGEETREFIKKDVADLYGMIEEVSGPLAADGGRLCRDLFGELPEIGWERITKAFLRNE